MSAVLCSRCSSPLSIEAVAGHVPCAYCGAVNAPDAPPANPYAPKMLPSGALEFSAPQPAGEPWVCGGCGISNPPGNQFCSRCGMRGAKPSAWDYAQQPKQLPSAQPATQAWACPACRHENQAHYKFCLGCGIERPEGAALVEPRAPDAAPYQPTYGADGNPAFARQRSPVGLVILVVVLIVGGAIAGLAAMMMAR